ncbi:hypothetical protein AVEN_20429-1 [Araneus ventricosus]|uniref:Uncharacterized protein n=1 Tax=Araneus ventricosus TaxID=182803 RepID=A0A4Y2P641_ARAVE|nr:hypothetical protein AVEN_20429-1 [Araneus ventricosus]
MRNLQQPLRAVPRSPSVESFPLMPEYLPIFLRNGRAIPQTLEQQLSFLVPRWNKAHFRRERRTTVHPTGSTTVVVVDTGHGAAFCPWEQVFTLCPC